MKAVGSVDISSVQERPGWSVRSRALEWLLARARHVGIDGRRMVTIRMLAGAVVMTVLFVEASLRVFRGH